MYNATQTVVDETMHGFGLMLDRGKEISEELGSAWFFNRLFFPVLFSSLFCTVESSGYFDLLMIRANPSVILSPQCKAIKYHKRPHNRPIKALLGPTRPQMAVKTQHNNFATLNSRLSVQFEAILLANIFCSIYLEHFLLMIPRQQQEKGQQKFFRTFEH